MPSLERRFETAIGQSQVFAPRQAQRLRSSGRLASPNLHVAVRRRFAVGQIEHADTQTLLVKLQDGASHAEFCVVRVRRNHQHVERCRCGGQNSSPVIEIEACDRSRYCATTTHFSPRASHSQSDFADDSGWTSAPSPRPKFHEPRKAGKPIL